MTKKQLLNKINQWYKLRDEIVSVLNTEFYKRFCDNDCYNCELGVCDEYGCRYCLFFDASAQAIEEKLKKKIDEEN